MRRLPVLREALPLSGSQAFKHMEGPVADRSEGITFHIECPGDLPRDEIYWPSRVSAGAWPRTVEPI